MTRRGGAAGAAKRGTFVSVDSPPLHFVQLNAFSVMRVTRIHFTVPFLYDGKSGRPASIGKLPFVFSGIRCRCLLCCHILPVVVIKHLSRAYKKNAAGAFHDITRPDVNSDLPPWSEGKKSKQ